MPKEIQGVLTAQGLSAAVVVSRFNEFITSRLEASAIDTWLRHGGEDDRLTIVRTPGSFETPLVARTLAASGRHDVVVCLGCVIRGETDHYDHVVAQASAGIRQAALDTGRPVIFGVITADTLEQAIDRAGAKQGNHGAKAMLAAIEMASLMKAL